MLGKSMQFNHCQWLHLQIKMRKKCWTAGLRPDSLWKRKPKRFMRSGRFRFGFAVKEGQTTLRVLRRFRQKALCGGNGEDGKRRGTGRNGNWTERSGDGDIISKPSFPFLPSSSSSIPLHPFRKDHPICNSASTESEGVYPSLTAKWPHSLRIRRLCFSFHNGFWRSPATRRFLAHFEL